MKCKYCNADVEQNARFCTTCGKDLSVFDKCVSCGELIDKGTSVCPYCGREQPEVVEQTSSKKWIWAIVGILLIALIGGGYYYLSQNGAKTSGLAEAVDSDSIAIVETDPQVAKEFLESMYKEFYEPYNLERSEVNILSKYFTAETMRKFYVESDYEEGKFFYCTDFLVNGKITGGDMPDYGDKVVSRTIEYESDGWFLVTNIWDVIQKPVKVRLHVKLIDGTYKVVDIRIDETDEEEEAAPTIEEGITIEDAITIAKNIVMENGRYNGLRSLDDVNSIMKNYAYEYEERYFVSREFDFKPLYYKNCIFAQSTKQNGETYYNDVPTTMGEGVPSFVGFDGFSGNLIIAPFTESAFNDYLRQIEERGGKLIEEDEDVLTYKLESLEINAFKRGVHGISYCITISNSD